MLPYTLPEDHRVVDVAPKPVHDSKTGEQQVSADGTPLWAVSVKMMWTDSDGDGTNERIKITVPSAREPQGLVGQRIQTEGLEQGFVVNHRESQFTVYYRARSVSAKQKAGVGAEK